MILAVGSVLSPLVFGYVMWRMSQIFVSKSEFNELKLDIERRESEINNSLTRINDNITELLQRTARFRESKR